MNIILSQQNGERLEGILLAAGSYSLRLMLPGSADVTELRREYGQWSLETGEPVELESMVMEFPVDFGQYAVGTSAGFADSALS